MIVLAAQFKCCGKRTDEEDLKEGGFAFPQTDSDVRDLLVATPREHKTFCRNAQRS